MKILAREPSNFAPDTEIWMVSAGLIDQTYRLVVTAPPKPVGAFGKDASGKRACGLIALDGDQTAGVLNTVLPMMGLVGVIPPTVLVAIAYPLGFTLPLGSFHNAITARTRDLTPTRIPAVEEAYSEFWGTACPRTGGADAFLSFIEEEVKPAIEEAHNVDPKQWTLTGGSFGGLFTLHTLMSKPGSFRRYNSVSPSAWWQRPLMFDRARAFVAESQPVDVALYVAVGDQETPNTGQEQNKRGGMSNEVSAKLLEASGGVPTDMRGEAIEIADILAGKAGLRVKSQIMEDESHNTVFGVAQSRGLRWLHQATAP